MADRRPLRDVAHSGTTSEAALPPDRTTQGSADEAAQDEAAPEVLHRSELELLGQEVQATTTFSTVLAHRHEWFRDAVARRLEDGGVRVVARLDNGADAVGVTVAEQPDLVLVGDALVMVSGAMVSGEQVVRDVRRFAPEALVAARTGVGPAVREVPAASRHGPATVGG